MPIALLLHSLSNKMDNASLVVRCINYKYIVVREKSWNLLNVLNVEIIFRIKQLLVKIVVLRFRNQNK